MDLTLSSTVIATEHAASSQLEEEAVVLDLDRGMYYALDRVGAAIWELIQEPVSVEAVRDALVGRFDVEPTRCEADMLAFLHELHGEGLIEVVSAEAS